MKSERASNRQSDRQRVLSERIKGKASYISVTRKGIAVNPHRTLDQIVAGINNDPVAVCIFLFINTEFHLRSGMTLGVFS